MTDYLLSKRLGDLGTGGDTNEADIATNTAAIATNVADIATNAADIATIEADVWDDLRFPASGISIGGLSTPPGIQTDTGLFLFDPATIETVAILAQLPHAWKEGSSIKPHIHWAKTSDEAGDVQWSLRYKWFNVEELQGSWSSVITATLATADPGSTQIQNISSFGEISGVGKSISSLFLCQLARFATVGSDTYDTADALMYEFDIHYQIDSRGSTGEFSK